MEWVFATVGAGVSALLAALWAVIRLRRSREEFVTQGVDASTVNTVILHSLESVTTGNERLHNELSKLVEQVSALTAENEQLRERLQATDVELRNAKELIGHLEEERRSS